MSLSIKKSCMIWFITMQGFQTTSSIKKVSLTAVFYLKNVSVDLRNPFPFRLLSAKPNQSGCGVSASQ
ncbi:hypothetical protein ABES21_07175 [Peribacillus frigoritolerans]|uniref:hypothetical protein n=1 Tax=Peribacillus frigoritolerans TaxID=450367 RepID=UPI003D2B63C7